MKIPAKGDSKYLSKEDVAHPATGTMGVVKQEAVRGERGDETKFILYFQERWLKPMVLNVTNRKRIIAAFGDETDKWTGHKVEIYVDPDVEMGGEIVGGVRIRVAEASVNGHVATASLWTFDQAVTELLKVGLTKEHLVEKLKSQGHKGWQQVRDNPTVKELIASVSRAEEQAFGEPAGDEEIPF